MDVNQINSSLAHSYRLQKTSNIKETTIFLPCDGEGRNAIFAAKLGLIVISFDASSAGVEKH
tara:strand:- start:163 stop:348 length:186 start_codon:yes stop_codon:yes gene_type:complete